LGELATGLIAFGIKMGLYMNKIISLQMPKYGEKEGID
jgi:hypothetical protein